MKEKIDEQFVVNKFIDFMINKENGNWHEEKVEKSELHKHGVDIKLVGGKRNSEYFYIECRGKSYAKSAKSINREGWLNALGQIITRMDVKRYSISKEVAEVLCLHIFSVNDEGIVKYFTPSMFGKEYTKEIF